MPSGFILHKGNSLSFDGLCNNGSRLTFGLLRFLKCCTDLVEIISINHDRVEIKCLKLLINRIRRTYFVNLPINLQIIIVYNHYQIVQLPVSCPHSSLPDLSLLNLTISGQGVYTIVLVIKFSGCCHTYCSRNSLPQRSTGHINARNMLHIRMSLQIRTCMAQCHKIFLREKSALCKCGIISRCYMSFGQYKTVTILHLRVLWINIHLFEIQICKNICRRQRSARMTGFCAVHCSYNALADFIRKFFQF